MRNLLFAALLFFAACSKKVDVDQTSPVTSTPNQQNPEVCNFGITEFNLAKRSFIQDFDPNMRRRPTTTTPPPTTPPPPPPPPPPAGASVIFLDFDGHVVTGTSWNYTPTINCAPANLTTTAIIEIIDRVSNDYSPFNIVITTSEAEFIAANPSKRTRVIITESWQWYGQAGGVSFVNSFTNGSQNPAFVFSSLLSYSTKKIAEAISHEAGHTLGLYHQAKFDANCTMTTQYHSGTGEGETSWAPIMGVGYSRNLTLWHNGQTSYGCNVFQNDLQVIANVVGYKTDDYSNTTSGAVALSGFQEGMLNSSTDVDYFSINTSVAKTITVTPFNVGASNAGANLDIVLKLYNSQGQLISTVDNASALNATVTINPGNYFVSVGSVTNTNTSNYGMLGKYNISIN